MTKSCVPRAFLVLVTLLAACGTTTEVAQPAFPVTATAPTQAPDGEATTPPDVELDLVDGPSLVHCWGRDDNSNFQRTDGAQAAPTPSPDTPCPGPDALDRPARLTIVEDAEPGFVDDGVLTPEYPETAMWFVDTRAIDPSGPYMAFGRRGYAEPGDGGCWEGYADAEQWAVRSSAQPGDGFSVEAMSEPDASDAVEWVPLTGAGLLRAVGVSATFDEPLPDGDTRRTIRVGPNAMANVLLQYGREPGSPQADEGTITFVEDATGSLSSVSIVSFGQNDPVEGRRPRYERRSLEITYEPFDPATERITLDSTWSDTGFCLVPPPAIVGAWSRGVPEDPSDEFVDLDLVVAPDGALTISAPACATSIAGQLVFDTIDPASLTHERGKCADPGAEAAVDELLDGMEVSASLVAITPGPFDSETTIEVLLAVADRDLYAFEPG